MGLRTLIKVFITSNNTMGFEIQTFPKGDISASKYVSSTLGSKRWEAGEFDNYKNKIYVKTREILTKIHLETEKHF